MRYEAYEPTSDRSDLPVWEGNDLPEFRRVCGNIVRNCHIVLNLYEGDHRIETMLELGPWTSI